MRDKARVPMRTHMKYLLLRYYWICALGFAALLPGTASATPITLTLTVQAFQLCNDAGNNCASLGPAGDEYFAAETNTIWAQAGISVGFNFVQQIDSTNFSAINDSVAGDTFGDLAAAYGTMGPSSSIVDMFLVHTIMGAYGEAWVGAGGLAIAMDTVMAVNSGAGRIDTIAHELGHNFGLDPYGVGYHSANPDYLMSGTNRNVPGTAADIYPDGLKWDQIPQDQIDYARASDLLEAVPEPGTMVLMVTGVGILGIGGTLRRRKIRN
jgi:hypothetical protein